MFCNSYRKYVGTLRLGVAVRRRGRRVDVESETVRLRRRITKFLLSAAREIT